MTTYSSFFYFFDLCISYPPFVLFALAASLAAP